VDVNALNKDFQMWGENCAIVGMIISNLKKGEIFGCVEMCLIICDV
jgi:hypothetical protein